MHYICFKRVRINKTKKSEVEKLYDIVRYIKGKEDDVSKEKLAKTVEAIAEVPENRYK